MTIMQVPSYFMVLLHLSGSVSRSPSAPESWRTSTFIVPASSRHITHETVFCLAPESKHMSKRSEYVTLPNDGKVMSSWGLLQPVFEQSCGATTISFHLPARSKRNPQLFRGASQSQNYVSRSLLRSGIILSMVLSVKQYNKENHSGLSRGIMVH